MIQFTSRTAAIRDAAKHGGGRAETMLADLLRDLFAIDARTGALNHAQYRLISLTGWFDTSDGAFCF